MAAGSGSELSSIPCIFKECKTSMITPPVLVMLIPLSDVIDRCPSGRWRPWESEGRHVRLLESPNSCQGTAARIGQGRARLEERWQIS